MTRNILLLLAVAVSPQACSNRPVGYDRYLFVWAGRDEVHLFSLWSKDTVTVAVPTNGLTSGPRRWSPDGSKVLLGERHVLWVDSLAITEFPIPGLLKGFSPDGQWVWLFEPDTGHVLRIRPDGTDPEVVAQIILVDPLYAYSPDIDPYGGPGVEDVGPCVSPDGRRMMWHGEDAQTHDSTGLFFQDLPDGNPRQFECTDVDVLELANCAAHYVQWSVDSRSVFLSPSHPCELIHQCDVETGEVNTVAQVPEYLCVSRFMQSPDGKYLAVDTIVPLISSICDLFIADMDTGITAQLTDGWRYTFVYTWTYDSKYLIFDGDEAGDFTYRLFMASVLRGEITRPGFPEDMYRPMACPVPKGLHELGQ